MGDSLFRHGFTVAFLVMAFLFECMAFKFATQDFICMLGAAIIAFMSLVMAIVIRYVKEV